MMKRYSGILFCIIFLSSCSIKPRPIQTGTDVCAFCKMTVMEKKFAGEIVTEKGRILTFDDIGCMVNYLHQNKDVLTSAKAIVVSDFYNENNLINASTAYLYKSEELETPMNGSMAAHSTHALLDTMKKEQTGIEVPWSELIK